MYRLRHAPMPVLAASLALLLAGPVSAATPSTERVSVSRAGRQGNSWSGDPSTSADGRFVAFWSRATDLVARDTNGYEDIFVRDRERGTTELVSVSSAGEQADDWSWSPAISADGRFVAFTSYATNLATGDAHDWSDVFVRDRTSGTTERVNVSSAGEQANDGAGDPSTSADGRFVAFSSFASNLVAGDTNGMPDVFVRDRERGMTELVSVSTAGEQANDGPSDPSISADGRFVAFVSESTNLVAGDTSGHRGRLRARPGAGHDETRERVERREAGERPVSLRVDLRGRPLRRLRVLRHQPRGGRHEPRGRHLRARPSGRHDRARERVQWREAGERLRRPVARTVDLRGRPVRRLLVRCLQPRGW